jgi:hypothetical protein
LFKIFGLAVPLDGCPLVPNQEEEKSVADGRRTWPRRWRPSALGEKGTRIIFSGWVQKIKGPPGGRFEKTPFSTPADAWVALRPPPDPGGRPLCDTDHGGNGSTRDSGSRLEGTITISTTSSTRGTSRDEKGGVHFVFAICQKRGDADNAAAAFFADKANLCTHQTECAQKKKRSTVLNEQRARSNPVRNDDGRRSGTDRPDILIYVDDLPRSGPPLCRGAALLVGKGGDKKKKERHRLLSSPRPLPTPDGGRSDQRVQDVRPGLRRFSGSTRGRFYVRHRTTTRPPIEGGHGNARSSSRSANRRIIGIRCFQTRYSGPARPGTLAAATRKKRLGLEMPPPSRAGCRKKAASDPGNVQQPPASVLPQRLFL